MRFSGVTSLLLGLVCSAGIAKSLDAPRGDDACQPSPAPNTTAPRENIWLGLSVSEYESVQTWLCEQPMFKRPNSTSTSPPGTFPPSPFPNGTIPFPNGTSPFPNGTTPFPNATNPFPPFLNVSTLPCSYRVGVISFLTPNKSEAISYLDGKTNTPPRYAQAPVFFQRGRQIYTQTYAIGPLPISNHTTMQPLYTFTRDETKATPRLSDSYYPFDFDYVLHRVVDSMQDTLVDLLGAVPSLDGPFLDISGSPPKLGGNLDPKLPPPPYNDTDLSAIPYRSSSITEGGRIMRWIEFLANPFKFDTGLMLPQGLFLKFDVSGNSTLFRGVLYNNIMYNDTDSFRKAWKAPGFEKMAKMKADTWTTGDRAGKPMPMDARPPPVEINPHARYAVDAKNQYVEWMDFSFYLGFSPSTGISLHEVKYKGERIIFELGLQEALAFYAGNDPLQSQTVYLDASYGMGSQMYELVRGYDCPTTATYLNASSDGFNGENVCIFEKDAGYPLVRHRGPDYVSVIKNNVLTVRFISTLGNYDYLFDYSFYNDGSIEVTARASGYIEGAYYAKNEEYGYIIQDAMSGSMHDHVINFKLDIDVNGTANTLQRVDIKPTTAKYSWSSEPMNTMKLERTFIENEDQGKINWTPNSGSMYVVVNKEAKNQWGELRGYKLSPGVGSPVHLTVQNSSTVKQTANFATHHLFVTKQKDSEQASSTFENILDPDDPLIDFNKFFNGESLDQQDLVLWFNLGMHHVPHSGDLPYTVFTTAQSSMIISPYNYLASSPVVQSNQAIKIKLTGDFDPSTFTFIPGKPNVTTTGGEPLTCMLDMNKFQPNFDNYM